MDTAIYKDEIFEHYVYIADWEQYYELPDGSRFDNATLQGDFVCFGEKINAVTNSISCTRIQKDTNTVLNYTVMLDAPLYLSETQFSFVSDTVGYCFAFYQNRDSLGEHLSENSAFLLKTIDGGKNWDLQEHLNVHHYKEGFTDFTAQFFTESIGYITVKYRAESNADRLTGRTYFTQDGGKTWTPLKPLPEAFAKYEEMGICSIAYVCDFFVENDLFILKVSNPMNASTRYLYSSSDLKSWKFVRTQYETDEPDFPHESDGK